MVISKTSYGHGEYKIIASWSVHTPYLPLRGSKLPRFMGCSIGPRIEVCETSTLPIPMVPRFHQSNDYMKTNLRAWRVENCVTLVGTDTVLTTALKSKVPHFMGGSSIGPRMEICETSALPIPMVRHLYQSNG